MKRGFLYGCLLACLATPTAATTLPIGADQGLVKAGDTFVLGVRLAELDSTIVGAVITVSAVPEPAPAVMLAFGLTLLAAGARHQASRTGGPCH